MTLLKGEEMVFNSNLDGGPKMPPPTNFSFVTSANVRISS